MEADHRRTGRPPGRVLIPVTPLEKWAREANCRGLDSEAFFPVDAGYAPQYIERICERCPVSTECLAWGMRYDEEGVWGGMTQKQRRRLLKVKERRRCPLCRGSSVVPLPRCAVCVSCGTSWRSPMPHPTSTLAPRS